MKNRFLLFLACVLGCFFAICGLNIPSINSSPTKAESAFSTPFYNFKPHHPVFRGRFYTSFSTSTEERKNNIEVASKALNNTLVAPSEEFSFNKTVGERTEKRGYKQAKIIVNGKFVDGIGGGVCQVSTTLYNALLLSGMQITEYHPHSLPVRYIAPSFDAMVNSGSADLRFINNTHNPVLIKTRVDSDCLFVEIYGEPMIETYEQEYKITEEISPQPDEITKDLENLFPELYEGQKKYLIYPKCGYKSQGFLIKKVNGKKVWSKLIRNDCYKATRGVIVEGTQKLPDCEQPTEENLNFEAENAQEAI